MKETNLLLYRSPQGKISIEVFFQDETAWLTQEKMAQLFGVQRPAITKHLKNIFAEGELQEAVVSSILELTTRHGAIEGKTQQKTVKYYNLDAIIAVGYRVNSYQATQFRIWATQTLKDFIIKGFVLDDERLKQGKNFGQDYFEDLLERIREIRASERRFYQKITDLYALAADYDKHAPITQDFFASVQNKLHWAITGKTAAEIIHDSADASRPNMGLTSWKQAPEGKILKSDVAIAKNYLPQSHIEELNRIVSAYLDLAENQAKRQLITRMEDWAKFLNQFLELSRYPILPDLGRISALEAKLKAEQVFESFRVIQDQNFISDFDQEIKRIQGKNDGGK